MSQPNDSRLHVIIPIKHQRQRYTWDCGLTCVMMVLDTKSKQNFQSNFHEICVQEGFGKSTWTIDLCYLLKSFSIKHTYYTVTYGVHAGYKEESFYEKIFNKDEFRVNKRFEQAKDKGIEIQTTSVYMETILNHLATYGPAIVLTNSKLLQCSLCQYKKVSLRKYFRLSVPYLGHYIVLCGFNSTKDIIYYKNPAVNDDVCAMSFKSFEESRKCFGTDEDIILIYS